MPEDDNLYTQLQDRKLEFDKAAKKAKDLQDLLQVEYNPALKAQLDFQHEKAVEECDKARQNLQDLAIFRVCSAMLDINYRKQEDTFREVVASRRAGAFLIHGPHDCGHLWLLKRLLVNVHAVSSTPPLEFPFSTTVKEDVVRLWRELAYKLGLPKFGTPPEEVVAKARKKLETQHLVLVMHDVDAASETQLKDALEKFWLPLAQGVLAAPAIPGKYKLLLFLVDKKGTVCSWDLRFATADSPPAEPPVPVLLPPLPCFSDADLKGWIEFGSGKILKEVDKNAAQSILGILAESDGGVPDLAAQCICKRFGIDYYTEEQWLKL